MSTAVATLLTQLKDPRKEISLIRKGLQTGVIESFLAREGFFVKDVLERLNIPVSTYFAKKKNQKVLDAYSTEKFVRLIQVTVTASRILGEEEARKWLYRRIPSLGNEMPINMLDTQPGHKLVEQVLLQIEHGIYG